MKAKPTEPRAVLEALAAPSQQAAARMLGVDPSTMRRWIARKRFPPEVAAFLGYLARTGATIPDAMRVLGEGA